MNDTLQQAKNSSLGTRFLDLSLREQVLILLSGVVVIGLLAYTFLLEPILGKTARIEKQINAAQLQTAGLGEQIAEVKNKTSIDPNAPVRERIASLNEQLAKLDVQLRQQTSQLVPANQMANMLEGVLVKSNGIKLLELNSIRPTPIYLSKQVKDQPREPDLYRHGVSLILEGGYFDIHGYLQTLESLEWQFFWNKFDYQVDAYPKSVVELEIYTLSTSQAFIGV